MVSLSASNGWNTGTKNVTTKSDLFFSAAADPTVNHTIFSTWQKVGGSNYLAFCNENNRLKMTWIQKNPLAPTVFYFFLQPFGDTCLVLRLKESIFADGPLHNSLILSAVRILTLLDEDIYGYFGESNLYILKKGNLNE